MKEPADCWLAEYINHVAAAATFRAPPPVVSMGQYFTTSTQDIQLATWLQHSSFGNGDGGAYVYNAPFLFLPGWSRVCKQRSLTNITRPSEKINDSYIAMFHIPPDRTDMGLTQRICCCLLNNKIYLLLKRCWALVSDVMAGIPA